MLTPNLANQSKVLAGGVVYLCDRVTPVAEHQHGPENRQDHETKAWTQAVCRTLTWKPYLRPSSFPGIITLGDGEEDT